MAVSYLVQEEDGTSRLTLEDSSGYLLLEESGDPDPTPDPEPEQAASGGSPTPLLTPRDLLPDDDEDAIALVLALL